jgi:glycosyltransferase involved in cell wall biosynthesis
MRRRLLILTPTAGWGGAEEYMMTIARNAREAGWGVTVSLQRDGDRPAGGPPRPGEPGVRFVNAALAADTSPAGVGRQALQAARVLARVRPSVVMIVLPWPDLGLGLMLAAALTRVPTAVVFQLAPWPLVLPRRAPAYRWSQRHHAQWVAVSRQNREAIAAMFGVAPSGIQVIHNGVVRRDAADPALAAAARRALRQELGVAADARVLLTVGRLDAQKGHRDLLGAVPSVVAGRPDAVFAWAGDGPLRDALESEVQEAGLAGAVRILGHRTDVASLLLGCDVFVFPSRYEGHPFSVLEAMAAGVPVVTSDVGDVPEMVRAGIDGLVYPRGEVSELGSRLAWALDHPASMAEMAVSARTRVEAFSEEEMLHRTLGVLDRLSRRS